MGRYTYLGFPRDSDGKGSACSAGDVGSVSQSGRAPGKGMATHSSVLAWEILRTVELGGYSQQSLKESEKTFQLNNNRILDKECDLKFFPWVQRITIF